jgi:hypothetical protein
MPIKREQSKLVCFAEREAFMRSAGKFKNTATTKVTNTFARLSFRLDGALHAQKEVILWTSFRNWHCESREKRHW